MTDIKHPRFRFESWTLLIPLALGLFIRLLILFSAGTVTLLGDEKFYPVFGRILESQGTYNSLWPPGYPIVMAFGHKLFGLNGICFIRLLQVLCSVVIGYSIIQISHMIFGFRGALVTGFVWSMYLPLAFYTHRLWPETLFLTLFVPSIYLLLSYYLSESSQSRGWLILSSAGVLFGLSLYFKESPTYLIFLLTACLILKKPRNLNVVTLFPLSVLLVLMPLTIRNSCRYKRFVLVGATLGVNIQRGLNSTYSNYDYMHDKELVKRVHRDSDGKWDFVYRNFIFYGSGWKPSIIGNVIDRKRADMKSALKYALKHKKAFLLTRIKKMADFVTPLSFLVRDLSPRFYSGVLASDFMRRILISIGLGSVMILLSFSWINLVRLRDSRRALAFFILIFAYFGLTMLIMSMSRFRIPIVPFLLVLLGGTVVSRPRSRGALTTVILSILGLAVLVSLWVLNFEEVFEVIKMSWG